MIVSRHEGNPAEGESRMSEAIAAFPESREYLADLVREMVLDVEALQSPLRRCDLAACGGTCCHDGVYLSSEEARVIRGLGDTRRSDLEQLGAVLPEKLVVYGKWRDAASGPKTATKAAAMHQKVADYPKHFPDTSCVFLLDDARCALQVLADDEGSHSWFYKPLTCWLHPLSITSGPAHHPMLTLYSEDTDPQRYPDYDGFVCRTHCGRTVRGGEPAWKVLRREISTLGEIGGRDLIAELESAL